MGAEGEKARVEVWRCGGVEVWRCGGVEVGRWGGGEVWMCGCGGGGEGRGKDGDESQCKGECLYTCQWPCVCTGTKC